MYKWTGIQIIGFYLTKIERTGPGCTLPGFFYTYKDGISDLKESDRIEIPRNPEKFYDKSFMNFIQLKLHTFLKVYGIKCLFASLYRSPILEKVF